MELAYSANGFREINNEKELREINGGVAWFVVAAIVVVAVVVVVAAASFVAGVIDGYNGK